MIKAVIFDLDNTLYSYDANHIYGMEALAGYCRETFSITEEETREYYRKAGYIMANRIGTDTAAIHLFFRMYRRCTIFTGMPFFSI